MKLFVLKCVVLGLSLLSQSLLAVELSDFTGRWERYSEDRQLAERLDAKLHADLEFLVTEIRYFKQNQVVASGVSILSSQTVEEKNTLSGVMKFSSGIVMRLDMLDEGQKSVFFKMLNVADEPVPLGFSEFSFVTHEGKPAIQQDFYKDEGKVEKMRTGYFYKVN